MSDPFFDAKRAAGEYPPKGFGWMDDDKRKAYVEKLLDRGVFEPWMKREVGWMKLSQHRTVLQNLAEE